MAASNYGKPEDFCIRSDTWRRDAALRACAPATRGIFADLICLAFEDGADGIVLIDGQWPSVQDIAIRFGYSDHEVRAALSDLFFHMVLENIAFDGEHPGMIKIGPEWVRRQGT